MLMFVVSALSCLLLQKCCSYSLDINAYNHFYSPLCSYYVHWCVLKFSWPSYNTYIIQLTPLSRFVLSSFSCWLFVDFVFATSSSKCYFFRSYITHCYSCWFGPPCSSSPAIPLTQNAPCAFPRPITLTVRILHLLLWTVSPSIFAKWYVILFFWIIIILTFAGRVFHPG